MDTDIVSAVLMLIAGVGVFIIACSMLSSNIESVSSKQLKQMFSRASKSKLLGVGIGGATTALIQSSAATIVLVIGLVNAGVMSMPLAATITYGANIGTTVTAWIAGLGTLGANSISLMVIFAAFVGIGAFAMMFIKSDSGKAKCGIMMGFGLVFVALCIMKDSMGGLAQSPDVMNMISKVSNIFLLILIGFVITALTQSSSVTTAIIITMLTASTGLITLEQGIYIALGANIGSCVIVLISGFAGTDNGKKVSLIHLIFNVLGVIVFVIAGFVLNAFGVTYSGIFSSIFVGMPALQLATFHTTFKVVTTIIMLPITGLVLKLVDKIIKGKTEEKDEPHMVFLDNNLLRNPPIAVQQLKSEVINMSGIAMTNFKISLNMIRTCDFDKMEDFRKNEEELDYLNKEIARYLVKISKLTLSRRDRLYVSSVYHTITDLERIGDYAENIVEYAIRLGEINGSFSNIAIKEINDMEALVDELYEKIMEAYSKTDELALEAAFDIEEKIDLFTDRMEENHIKRLNDGICTLDVGAEYLSLASDTERIADHFMNVGKTIRDLA